MNLLCAWEIDLIKSIQNISNSFFDFFFKFITQFGAELAFIGVCAIILWCFDKKFGLKFAVMFLFGSMIVNVIKNFVARPRPFDNGAVSIGSKTHGYSFPSGHSQGAMTMCAALSIRYRKRGWWVIAVASVLVALVGLSRMYLGQHYLTDVLTGYGIALLVTFGLYYLFQLVDGKEEWYFLLMIPISIVLMSIFHSDMENHKDYFVAGGTACSLAIGYFIEKRYIKYDVKEKWWVQILKVAVGVAVAMGLKEGLKPLFDLMGMNFFLSTFLRYFLVGSWAMVGAMLLFKHVVPLIDKSKKKPGGGSSESAEAAPEGQT